DRLVQLAAPPRLEHARIDVRLAADRRRMAQLGGDGLHDRDDARVERALAALFGQRRGTEQRDRAYGRAPGAKILGGEVGAHCVPEILVYLAGVDPSALAGIVDIMKKMLLGQLLLAALHLSIDILVVDYELIWTVISPDVCI